MRKIDKNKQIRHTHQYNNHGEREVVRVCVCAYTTPSHDVVVRIRTSCPDWNSTYPYPLLLSVSLSNMRRAVANPVTFRVFNISRTSVHNSDVLRISYDMLPMYDVYGGLDGMVYRGLVECGGGTSSSSSSLSLGL